MSDSFPDDSYYIPEEERSYSTHILARRFYVFLEVFMAMLINFLCYLGFSYLLDLIPPFEFIGLINYSASLISIIISTLLSLLFIKAVFYKNKLPLKESAPPLKETVSLFTFKKFGIQMLFTFLLLFLVYIPLDFITYSIPGGIEFSLRSLLDNDPSEINQYLAFPQFGSFIVYGLIFHLMVGIREETFFRGFFSNRSDKYLNLGSTVVITSIAFALAHFSYIFISPTPAQDFLPAFIWTLGGFYVGSVSAVFILKTRMIWPIIFAHTLNNVVSSTVLWLTNVHSTNFWDIAKFFYLPLMGISVLLVAIFFQKVKTGVKSYFSAFKVYKAEIPDPNIRGKIIVADIFFGLLFWAAGYFFI